jgi:hypothetical protein
VVDLVEQLGVVEAALAVGLAAGVDLGHDDAKAVDVGRLTVALVVQDWALSDQHGAPFGGRTNNIPSGAM